jgi:hypothetical protein
VIIAVPFCELWLAYFEDMDPAVLGAGNDQMVASKGYAIDL